MTKTKYLLVLCLAVVIFPLLLSGTDSPIYVENPQLPMEETPEDESWSMELNEMKVLKGIYDEDYGYVSGVSESDYGKPFYGALKSGSNYLRSDNDGKVYKTTDLDGGSWTEVLDCVGGSTPSSYYQKYPIIKLIDGDVWAVYVDYDLYGNGKYTIKWYKSVDDGDNWTQQNAAVSGEDGYQSSTQLYACDVFEIDSEYYMFVMEYTAYPNSNMGFFKLSDNSRVDVLYCGFGSTGFFDGTNYYFVGCLIDAVSITAYKLYRFDGTSIIEVETIITSDFPAQLWPFYSILTHDLVDNYYLIYYQYSSCEGIYIRKNDSWMNVTEDEPYTNWISPICFDSNYYLKYYIQQYYIDGSSHPYAFKVYKVSSGGIFSIGLFLWGDGLNTGSLKFPEHGWEDNFGNGYITISDEDDYVNGKIIQQNHLDPKTLTFIDKSAGFIKGEGIVVYTNDSEECFEGKVVGIGLENISTGTVWQNITAKEMSYFDLQETISSDLSYSSADPSEPINDVLDNCQWLSAGTIDDESKTYDMEWKTGTEHRTILDDCEEMYGKLIHWKSDGVMDSDDGDQDHSEGAITLTDGTNCAVLSYSELGIYYNKILVNGGIDTSGSQSRGEYSELKEEDLGLGSQKFDISGLLGDSNCDDVAELLHDLHENSGSPIYTYNLLIQGEGCPEVGRKCSLSSTPLNLSARDVIIYSIQEYNIDSDTANVIAYDSVYIKPDSKNSQKQISANTNRISQVAGGNTSWALVNDSSPQLGGDLDPNGHSILVNPTELEVIPNDTYLKWRNAADSADLNVIKANSFNYLQIDQKVDFNDTVKDVQLENALDANSQKIENLAAASASGDAMRYDEAVRTSDAQTIAGIKTFSSSTRHLLSTDYCGCDCDLNNLDGWIWRVTGSNQGYDGSYGFGCKYIGTGSGDANVLRYYSANASSSLATLWLQVQQSGKTYFKNDMDLDSNNITSLADPTNDQDASTKAFTEKMGARVEISGSFTAGRCYYNDGSWAMADNDVVGSAEGKVIGFAEDTSTLILFGRCIRASHGYTLFQKLYLDDDGTLTDSEPTPASNKVLMCVGFAIDTDTIFITGNMPAFAK